MRAFCFGFILSYCSRIFVLSKFLVILLSLGHCLWSQWIGGSRFWLVVSTSLAFSFLAGDADRLYVLFGNGPRSGRGVLKTFGWLNVRLGNSTFEYRAANGCIGSVGFS